MHLVGFWNRFGHGIDSEEAKGNWAGVRGQSWSNTKDHFIQKQRLTSLPIHNHCYVTKIAFDVEWASSICGWWLWALGFRCDQDDRTWNSFLRSDRSSFSWKNKLKAKIILALSALLFVKVSMSEINYLMRYNFYLMIPSELPMEAAQWARFLTTSTRPLILSSYHVTMKC